ncbi:MAG: tetratricopeptide repeat protein [Candidatus Omnitrophota bacterium]
MNGRRWILFAHLGIIVFLTLLVYANSIDGKFLWDDSAFIGSNQYVKDLSRAPQLFTENFGQGVGKKYLFYRPLQMLTYAFDYSLWKLDPRGYHATSIVLHILVSMCVYWIVTLLFGDCRLSLFSAALFSVHPLHTSAVSSIAGRADPLAAVFLLAAFAIYIKNRGSWSVGRFISILALYICALLSRESSVILPFMILLYHFIFRSRPLKRDLSGIAALTVLYLIFRAIISNKEILAGPFGDSTLIERLPGLFCALTGYTRLLFFPTNLHMIYGRDLFNWSNPLVISGIAILLLLMVSAAKTIKSNALYSFGVLWFLLTLFPQSNLYPLNAYMAEHWLYIPSIGFCLILARGVLTLFDRRKLFVLGCLCMFTLVVLYSVLTIKQNDYWSDSETFCKRTLRYNPRSSWMYNNLGNALYAQEKKEEAIEAYLEAVELDPDFDYAYYNLATAYGGIGRDEEAVSFFKKAIDANPNYAHAYNNLGVAYIRMQNIEDAVSCYRAAIKIKPDYADAYFNLGNALFTLGSVEESVDSFKKAIEIEHNHINAYHNLATVYLRTKERGKAIEIYHKILDLEPDYPARP